MGGRPHPFKSASTITWRRESGEGLCEGRGSPGGCVRGEGAWEAVSWGCPPRPPPEWPPTELSPVCLHSAPGPVPPPGGLALPAHTVAQQRRRGRRPRGRREAEGAGPARGEPSARLGGHGSAEPLPRHAGNAAGLGRRGTRTPP